MNVKGGLICCTRLDVGGWVVRAGSCLYSPAAGCCIRSSWAGADIASKMSINAKTNVISSTHQQLDLVAAVLGQLQAVRVKPRVACVRWGAEVGSGYIVRDARARVCARACASRTCTWVCKEAGRECLRPAGLLCTLPRSLLRRTAAAVWPAACSQQQCISRSPRPHLRPPARRAAPSAAPAAGGEQSPKNLLEL